ncbi:hypothetical protein MTR_8g063215 [Medicago truncatula]|uniref:Uncharacterized protein n=1 Tax=Medicago truncatula TaxID=3880 RepID=A0A072TSY3_MEDTR|nr:hypothetical protein MTR_8g063215 [Medicago truncatula]
MINIAKNVNGTKRTLQQDMKSNNVAQDDEQHNVALGQQNHKKLDICENHLFRLKRRKKIQMDDSRSKNDLKSLIPRE